MNGKKRVLKTPTLQISFQDGNVDIFEGPFDFKIFQTKNENNHLKKCILVYQKKLFGIKGFQKYVMI